MNASTLTALAVAATAIVGTSTLGAPSAEAGYKVRHYGYALAYRPVHYVKPVYYVRPVHYVAPVVAYSSGCAYAYKTWLATGSHHWKHKYLACKGW